VKNCTNDAENTLPTHHEKILVAKVRESTINNFEQEFLALFQLASNAENNMSLVAKMKELVPEFVSNNSVYEQLDGNNATVVSIKKVG